MIGERSLTTRIYPPIDRTVIKTDPCPVKSDQGYRRVDIIELKMKNPERYRMLEPEIMKAYKEGRII